MRRPPPTSTLFPYTTLFRSVLQVGEPREVVSTPGLHVKLPWPFQNVLYLDKRVLVLDLPAEEVIAQDRKRLVVDADRKSTRLNSSHPSISYAVFCLKKKKKL